MSLDELRAAAEAARVGPWISDVEGDPPDGFGTVFVDDAETWAERTWLFDPREATNADAVFVAAASPDVVLALIEVAEAARLVTGSVVTMATVSDYNRHPAPSREPTENEWQTTVGLHPLDRLRAALDKLG